MTPKIVNKEVKKQEILKAAMRVFAQNGVVKTKMTDIAEAAGIGKGTIYEYFRSKEDIFSEAYNLVFMGIEVKIGEVLKSDIGSEEKLKMLLKVSLEGFLGNGGKFAGIMMEFWSEGIRNKDERMIEIINMKKMYSEYRGMIARVLEEGMSRGIFRKMDTFMTASVLIGAMDGILLQWIIDPKIYTPQKAVEVLVESYVNGIKK